MLFKKVAAVAVLPLLCTLSAEAGSLDLAVRDRAPEYTIVHAADASPSVKYAARELRDFTAQMTGVRLPITTNATPQQKSIVLREIVKSDCNGQDARCPSGDATVAGPSNGQDARCPSGDDAFHIVARQSQLIVEGGKRGVLYGVYELLEKFGGCRWYASWHTVIPSRDTFSVPDDLDDAQKPAFSHREPFWWDMFNPDFAARNRANGSSMKLGPKHGGVAGRFGQGLGSCHTFAHLLPVEKYFDKHPEYFSMVKGKRIKDHPQLCLTNPDVLRIVTSNVLEHIRKDPTADYYGVSQNDWNNFCECPECAAVDAEEESHAGTMIRFVNAIAEAVEKEFPDKIIETLAYTYTRKPPKKTKLRHNVMPCLCTVECDMSRPLPESRYVQNVKFVDDIKTWHEQASRLYLWDYVTDFHALPYPFPDVYALQGNVQFFRDNGVYALFAQGSRHGCHAGFAELKAWLLAKWMWNPDLPMKPLLDDFFAGFYGAGAPFVREYFEELHRLQIAYTSADTNRWLNCHQNIPCPDIPVDFWDRAEKLLDQAAVAVKGDKTLEYNVRTALLGVDYVRVETLRKAGGTVADLSDAGTARKSLARQRFLVNRALAFMDEAKNVRFRSSAKKDGEILAEWRKIADGTISARADGIVEDGFMKLPRLGKGNDRVDDPLAEDGHAVKLSDTESHWTILFPMTGVTFESGRRYTLRMRLRADLVPERKGQAATVGIYDPKTKKYGCTNSYRAEQLSGDYAWYDVGDFDPAELSDRAYIYVGDGYLDKEGKLCANALYLDKFQFREAKPSSDGQSGM
jgi:hypothetical protein